MGKKIIVIPDSFKGSMTSETVTEIISEEAEKKGVNCTRVPIADGGEGSVECVLKAVGGHKEYAAVLSPEGLMQEAYYGITDDHTAIVEIAESSGLVKQTSFDALGATSYGFGQLILHGLDQGCRKFVLALGGSATTDGGCGMAAALGVRFLDSYGDVFVPTGGSLSKIEHMDLSKLDPRVKDSEFTVMCDVDNLLYGTQGAAYIYGPQKGATPEQVEELDQGLRHFCEILSGTLHFDYSSLQGGGAAGGCGVGCHAFLGARMQSGIETVLELYQFESLQEGVDLIISGEGKVDEQSLMGKVVSGIRKHSNQIPMVVFCGICDVEQNIFEEKKIHIIEIGKGYTLQESMKNGKELLRKQAKQFFEDWGND